MIHAADHRLATINRARGQQLDNEIVAEFGGAVLLECLGLSTESDRGGAFDYIQRYCRQHDRSLMSAVTELIDRTCNCVALILETADHLEKATDVQQVA